MTRDIPKYVETALKKRTKCIVEMRLAEQIIDDYAEKIGILPGTEEFDDACLTTDIRIFCEVDCCESRTREALRRKLHQKIGKEEK